MIWKTSHAEAGEREDREAIAEAFIHWRGAQQKRQAVLSKNGALVPTHFRVSYHMSQS